MAKINWGTTASILGAVAPSVVKGVKNKMAMNKTPKGSSDASSGGNSDDPATPGSFKRGGKVKKTGMAKVHKGERVLTKKQQKQRRKSRGKY